MKKSITFRAFPIEQPVGTFYIAVLDASQLTQISYADVRRLEDRDVERYLGIQRPLNEERVRELKKYVRLKDATFPTSVILAVEAKCASWNAGRGELTLSEYESVARPTLEQEEEVPDCDIPFGRIAKILDGQHRVAGLEEYSGKTKFDVNVAIFVDVDVSEQANIFATVNLAQTKVNKSLVYDLAGLASHRSPQKSAHNIAVALDSLEASPLHERIKRLGVATQGRFGETLTQATVVESLLRLMTKDPMTDRDTLLRGGKLLPPNFTEHQRYPFRGFFVREEDEKITKILWNYFNAVSKRWPDLWEDGSRGNILVKTNGFRALMRFLKPAYIHLSTTEEVVRSAAFGQIFARVTLKPDDFTIENFPPGTSGEAALLRRIRADTGI